MSEISEEFKKLTLDVVQNKLIEFQTKAEDLLFTITKLEYFYETENQKDIQQRNKMLKQRAYFMNNMGIENYKDLEKDDQALYDISNVSRKLTNARKALGLNQVYSEAYHLLTEIGAFFRGTWEYRLTLTHETRGTYSFIMNGEDYVSRMLTFGLEGASLKDTETIFNTFLNTLVGIRSNKAKGNYKTFGQQLVEEKRVRIEEWNYENKIYNLTKYELYNAAVNAGVQSKADSIIKQGGEAPKYNEGQRREGYLALVDENNQKLEKIAALNSHMAKLVAQAESKHLGSGQYGTLVQDEKEISELMFEQLREQTNSAGFWTGPDTSFQEKGNDAGAFQYSSIINQLQKVRYLFKDLDFTTLEQKSGQVEDQAIDDISKTYQNIIESLVAHFNTSGFNADVTKGINEAIRAQLKSGL